MLKKFTYYLIISVVSLLISFFVLEILLRILGGVFLFIQEQRNKQDIRQNGYRVLCVGESTTGLGGQDSYPSQLEGLLNQQSSIKFKVINKGIPGQGSRYIADHVGDWVKQYSPNVVIVMMGINDGSDRIPVNDLMRQRGGINAFLADLRVYKLFRWLYLNIKNVFMKSKAHQPDLTASNAEGIDSKIIYLAELALKEKEYTEAEKLFKYIAYKGKPITNWKARMKLHEIYFATGNIPALLSMVEKNPQEPVNIEVEMRLCKDPNSFNYVMDLFNRHLQNSSDRIKWYDLMGGCLANQGLRDQAKVFFDLARSGEMSKVGGYTRANYLRVMELLEQRSIQVVAMQYPLRRLDSLKLMLTGVKLNPPIVFLGNELNFKQALMSFDYDEIFSDRFAGDFGHCRAKGNKLIAQNVAAAILDQEFRLRSK